MGVSPYSSWQDELQLAKNGEEAPRFDNPGMWFGREMEEPNMRAFAKITRVLAEPCQLFVHNPKYPSIAATLDGLCLPPLSLDVIRPFKSLETWASQYDLARLSGLGVVEMKNVSSSQASKWKKDLPPEYYEYQVRTQLMSTGLTWGLLVAKIDSCKMRAFVIEHDDFIADGIHEKATEFMAATKVA